MSPLAQAIVALLEKLAEDELPVIGRWIEERLAPTADPNTTQPAPAQPEQPAAPEAIPPRESPTKP